LDTLSENFYFSRGVDPGDWGSGPLKIYSEVRVCFELPQKVIFFHSKLLLYNSASFTASRMNSCTLPLHWPCLC